MRPGAAARCAWPLGRRSAAASRCRSRAGAWSAAAGHRGGGRGGAVRAGGRRAAITKARRGGLCAADVGLHRLHELPYDDPARLERRVRVDYPIAVDRALFGRAPDRRPPAGAGAAGTARPPSTTRWSTPTGPGSSSRTPPRPGSCGGTRSASRGRRCMICAVFDLGLVGYFLVPTAPPWWAAEQGRIQGMRRIMVDVGRAASGAASGRRCTVFWEAIRWRPCPRFTSPRPLMAAHVLAETGPVRRGRGLGLRRRRSASRSSTWASTTSWTCSPARR